MGFDHGCGSSSRIESGDFVAWWGNPKIRAIQRQMAQRRMMAEVPKADEVITNPTHVAVALKYSKTSSACACLHCQPERAT